MDELTAILDWAARLTPIVLAVGGFIAFLSRERIKHYFAGDLEDRKAKLLRELEAYKLGVLAEAERNRAQQDVRKSVALKVVERRFHLLSELIGTQAGLDTDVTTFVQLSYPDQGSFRAAHASILERIRQHGLASERAFLYLPRPIRQQIVDLRGVLVRTLGAYSEFGSPRLAAGDPTLNTIFTASLEIERAIEAQLRDYENFVGVPPNWTSH